MKPELIDIFCGPGGLSLGFEIVGFNVVLGIDNNQNAVKTFSKNHQSSSVLLKDVTKIKPKEIAETLGHKEIDVIIGGPPCEKFSMANIRIRNLEKQKISFLKHFKHFAKIVEYFKPSFFVAENVPGILSIKDGKIKNKIFNMFERIGYTLPENGANGCQKYYLLNAVHFSVPQFRKRIFIIGSINGSLSEFDFKPETEKFITVNEAISDLPNIPKGGGGKNECFYNKPSQSNYQKNMRQKSKKLYNHIATKNKIYVIKRFEKIKQGENWRRIKNLMKNYKDLDKTHSWIYKRLESKKPSVTIANFRKTMLIHPTQNRLLSVREAARLQSFPDNYIFEGGISSMQEQVGDAVPVLLASKVASEILKSLK
jgi:DNA (cytosine-5)-methyltransferase 1